jgi:sugar phosphate isomerase/epimerase
MKLSIGNFSFFNTFNEGKMNVFGYLETVKYRYRLEAADLWNGFYCKRADGHLLPPDEEYIRRIREALDEKGLIVPNIAIDSAHIIDPNPSLREQLHRNALANIRAAEWLGAKTVRIDFCTSGVNELTEQDFNDIVTKYKEYCDHAAEHGYMIGPENHMGAALDPHLMKRIAEAVNHPNFGILLHFGRWNPGNDNGDEIVAPWVVHTHVDAKSILADKAAPSIQALKKAGYDGYWAIEYNAKENQYAEMEWALASVNRLLHHASEG